MIEKDREPFGQMMADVYRFYRRRPGDGDITEFDLEVWWTAMRPFDLEAIRQAIGRHAVNPDSGQFLPKPADVVKMLGGSTIDSALVAWTKYETAMQRLGPYRTVVFDDPLIHRVLQDMGGWVLLSRTSAKDWPFRQNEFVTRYRGYRMRNEVPAHPAKLIGITDGENASNGFKVDERNTFFIGDQTAARRVLSSGSESGGRLALTSLGDALQLEVKR